MQSSEGLVHRTINLTPTYSKQENASIKPSSFSFRGLLGRAQTLSRNIAIILAVAQLIYLGSSLATTLAAGWWISPEYMGIWRILSLCEAYAAFATFGIPNGFMRQFPIAKGAREHEAMALKIKALYLAHTVQGLIGTGVLAFMLARSSTLRASAWLPLAAGAYWVYFFIGRFRTSAEIFLRADGQFERLARAYVLLSGMRVITLALIPLWGFGGFLLRWPLSILIEWLVLQYACGLKLFEMLGLPSSRTLASLLRDGLPIIGISAIGAFSDSLDRTWLARHANASVVGHYLIADSVKLFFASLLGNIAVVQYNRCGLAYGRKDSKEFRRSVFSALRLLGLAYFGSIAILIISLVLLVPMLMPRYVQGIPASLAILVGGLGLTVASLGFPLAVTRRYGWLFATAVSGLCIQGLCQLLLSGRMADGIMVATAWSTAQIGIGIIMVIGVALTLREFTHE